jgi:hypothetical protein
MRRLLLPALLIPVILLVSGCVREEETLTPLDAVDMPERGFFLGILPTAADGQALEQAYDDAADICEFVPVWGRPTPFYDLAGDISGSWGRQFIDGLIRERGMFPLIHMSFIDKVDGELVLKVPPGTNATLSDPGWRETYIQAVEDVMRAARPQYISLGNEVNRWYEAHGAEDGNPNGFQHWVSLYEEAYEVAKGVSPETIVFCVFAREVVAENREANLSVLQMFDPEKLDLLVFTSYAVALREVNRSDDLPDDYFSRAFEYTDEKPVGFSELGWPVHPAFGREEGQADYLWDVVGRLTVDQGLDLELVAWNWLHDLGPGDTSGLAYGNGTRKMAFEVFSSISRGSHE